MGITAQITSLEFDKSFYRPGEPVRLVVHLTNQLERPVEACLELVISHLADPVDHFDQEVLLVAGEQTLGAAFTPPEEAPRGYGLDLRLECEAGDLLASAAGAFDVLERWTQSPRYGFLSDFSPDRSNFRETAAILNRYHINALQFYDWMYRHEQLLTAEEPYLDPLGRLLSRATTEALVAAAHERNMAAMPYTAVYGASVDFYRRHPGWGLANAFAEPVFFGEDFLVIMDPRPDTPWTRYLLDQFDQLLQRTDFDGIHLDQYGFPREGYDAEGVKFDLAGPLAAFIDATGRIMRARRPGGAVVFNAVNNWPVETVAPAGQDLVYIEVWPPHNGFADLHNLVVQAQALGGGKPVVLAAYIDPAWEANARLIDSVIFASGGAHIELGEGDGMLADPYFPNYKPISPGLAQALQKLYDFAVRYQDATGPRTKDATSKYSARIEIFDLERDSPVNTGADVLKNKVWPVVREGAGFTAVSLVNLLGLEHSDWNQPLATQPIPLGRSLVRIDAMERESSRVWLASPDGAGLDPLALNFSQEGDHLTFEIPSLAYWDLIVIEWSI